MLKNGFCAMGPVKKTHAGVDLADIKEGDVVTFANGVRGKILRVQIYDDTFHLNLSPDWEGNTETKRMYKQSGRHAFDSPNARIVHVDLSQQPVGGLVSMDYIEEHQRRYNKHFLGETKALARALARVAPPESVAYVPPSGIMIAPPNPWWKTSPASPLPRTPTDKKLLLTPVRTMTLPRGY